MGQRYEEELEGYRGKTNEKKYTTPEGEERKTPSAGTERLRS